MTGRRSPCYVERATVRAPEALAHLIPRIARFAANRLEQGDQPLGLSQLYVLQRVAAGTNRGVDLARRARVSPATMSGLLDRLVSAGLVQREPHPDDRRAYAVSISERGRAVLDATERRLIDGVDSLLDALPDEDRDAVARACTAIETALDARVAEATA